MTRAFYLALFAVSLSLVCGAAATSAPRRALLGSPTDIATYMKEVMGGRVADSLDACGDALTGTRVGELGASCSEALAAASANYPGGKTEVDLCPEPCKDMWKAVVETPSCLDAYGNLFGSWFGAVCGSGDDAAPPSSALFPDSKTEEPASGSGAGAPDVVVAKCGDWLGSAAVVDHGEKCGEAYEDIFADSPNPGDNTVCPAPCVEMWKAIAEEPACLDESGRVRGIAMPDECDDLVFNAPSPSPAPAPARSPAA